MSWVIRRAKAETVGTEIADITVCGAIAPYTHLLGGKLIAGLLASPTMVRAYHEKYRKKPSEIASSVAGRSIVRSAKSRVSRHNFALRCGFESVQPNQDSSPRAGQFHQTLSSSPWDAPDPSVRHTCPQKAVFGARRPC